MFIRHPPLTASRPLRAVVGARLDPPAFLGAELTRVADAMKVSAVALVNRSESRGRGRDAKQLARALRVATYYLYVECGMSERQIAHVFQRPPATVTNWLIAMRRDLAAAHLSALDDVLDACVAAVSDGGPYELARTHDDRNRLSQH